MTSPPGSSAPASSAEQLTVPAAAPSTTTERKTSIAFAALPNDPQHHRRLNSQPTVSFPSRSSIERPDRPRSLSSPPPPSHFVKRVGFDTFDNKDAQDFSLTLKAKHKDYVYSQRSRTFLCGTDQNEYSEFALEWLIDELVDDGDEIVCLRVVDKDSKLTSSSGSSQDSREKEYRAEAHRLLDEIIDKNEDDKAISIVLEFAVGKVQETIQRMIHIYEPVILIVGTRGRSLGGLQGLLPGSVSKYCLQHSPVPVIVVRPTNKREKKKKKRQADPSRNAYATLLEKSNNEGIFGMAASKTGSSTPIKSEAEVSPGTEVPPIVEGAVEAMTAPTDKENAVAVEKS